MAQRIHRFDITSAPQSPFPNTTTDRTDFPPGTVTAITVEIPHGHAGQTGFAIFYGNAQLIPFDGSAYIKGNAKTTRYDFDDPHPGGIGWFVEHFNAGRHPHVFHFAVELDELLTGVLLLPPVLLLRQSGESLGGASTVTVPASAPAGGPVRFE